MPPLCGPLQKDEHLFIYFYLITFTTTETGCVGGRTTERGSVTSSNILRKGSLQTKLNAGFSEQQQEDLFQNERSFHEVNSK